MENRNDFAAELNELLPFMTEDEIKKAIDTLNECRDDVFMNRSCDKRDLSKVLLDNDMEKAVVRFRKSGQTATGELKVLGATLLHWEDYFSYREKLPRWPGLWWLYGGKKVNEDGVDYYTKQYASIRPVLIVSEADQADLRPGDAFFIGTDEFKLITRTQAIMWRFLKDVCTYNNDYDSSIVQFCLKGWYYDLIRKHRTDSGSECVKSGT